MAVIFIDSGLIRRNLLIYEDIKPFVSAKALEECFKPQIVMRVIFSFYGINVSIILILVTLVSSCISNARHPRLHQGILKTVFFYSYMMFGPTLVCLCMVALSAYSDSLLFVCDPIKGKDLHKEVHYQNLVQISIALGISLCTTFIFTLFYVIYTF